MDDAESGGDLAREGATEAESSVDSNREFDPSAAEEQPLVLDRGESVDRYVVLYKLGSGGMGVVYAAYDPELDRKIALKLLHADRSGTRGRTRLLREAKAIAKLSHPNVVTVHDVGTYKGRVFMAMEFVDGVTLRKWVQQKRRSWKEIVDTLCAAGTALAAAHKLDLIHRDFKPDNILVERGGRVVVLDFGLARRAGTHDDEPSAERHVNHSHEFEVDLTRTGARLGTPAYMAPEQHLSAAVDGRSDQFAFCVVLWEALYGVRPFPGSSQVVASRIMRGEIEEPPKGAQVPGWIRRALVRGLAKNPRDRHPDMEALLQALRNDPRRHRGRILWSGGAVLAAAGVAWGSYRASVTAQARCETGLERWKGVWDAERQDALRHAFLKTEVTYAGATWDRVQASLDAYVGRWVEMHREACEATHVHHEQSSELLDLRMGCLRRRLGDVASLTAEFEVPDASVVQHAVEAVSALPRLDDCGDSDALASRAQVPADPVARASVERLRGDLSDAKAKELAGRYTTAFELASAVVREAEEMGFPPVLAEAQLVLGSVLERKGEFERAEAAFKAAIWAAAEGHHDALAAEAWARLVWVTGVERMQMRQGHEWARFARAALARAGTPPHLEALLTHNIGGLFYREGKLEDALASYRRALLIQERELGAADPVVATTLNHIGNTMMEQGDFARSREYCERSLALRRRVLGDRHPKVAASLNNLGELTRKQGRPDESLRYAEDALSITAGTGGPEEAVARVLAGAALEALDRPAQAAHHYERLLQIRESVAGVTAPESLEALRSLARARQAAGDCQNAVDLLLRAAAVDRDRNPGAAARDLIRAADCRRALGNGSEAESILDDAARLAQREDPPDRALVEEIRSRRP